MGIWGKLTTYATAPDKALRKGMRAVGIDGKTAHDVANALTAPGGYLYKLAGGKYDDGPMTAALTGEPWKAGGYDPLVWAGMGGGGGSSKPPPEAPDLEAEKKAAEEEARKKRARLANSGYSGAILGGSVGDGALQYKKLLGE
ncbi:MAG: hypothetical protein LBC79_10375 [Deltaproteobacteria bacterium]|jgi:hypothetical protein|nr:hypothetical protein [Deltaproteobacteria bacterium]